MNETGLSESMAAPTWAVIPVKSLARTKGRLAPVLAAGERAALTLWLLQRTLAILQSAPQVHQVLVVSRDQQVARLAHQAGAATVAEPEGTGLNGAVHAGETFALAAGARRLLVLPADLPLLTAVEVNHLFAQQAASAARLIIASDRHGQGTNLLLLPAGAGFCFQFGPDSFRRHLAEAGRLGLAPQAIAAPGFHFDLDTPQDWHDLQQPASNQPAF